MQYLNIEKNTITQKCSSFKIYECNKYSVYSSITRYRYKDNYYKLLF